MNKILLSLSLVLGFGLILATPAWADFQAGVNAYERGDYETALAEFRPSAVPRILNDGEWSSWAGHRAIYFSSPIGRGASIRVMNSSMVMAFSLVEE
ncbi:MAG: hypothetical protein IH978_07385 [Nitrospinae bacterium]|nr:hypothetical protein [Nitrospinota bacterium]